MELEVKNLSVELASKKILKSINLKVEDGEFISLLGASGCGKSTILKTIAGIVEQTEGSVYLGGRLADQLPPHKRRTVIVFQDFRLFPHMNVAENIAFPLRMNGVSKEDAREKALELLEKVQLEGFEKRQVHEMSGGQIQRVALARALAAQPGVLLLDEPFSSLDVNLRKDMRELVLKLQRELRITTILVTHDQEEALTMSDRIAFMNDGKIEQYDSPQTIFKYPKNRLVADYFSDGVYLDGRVEKNCFRTDYFSLECSRPDGAYECLIRPQAIEIEADEAGDYILLEKIYQGDSYMAKIKHRKDDFYLEALLDDTSRLEENSRLRLGLKKDKLIYLAK